MHEHLLPVPVEMPDRLRVSRPGNWRVLTGPRSEFHLHQLASNLVLIVSDQQLRREQKQHRRPQQHRSWLGSSFDGRNNAEKVMDAFRLSLLELNNGYGRNDGDGMCGWEYVEMCRGENAVDEGYAFTRRRKWERR